MAAFPRTETSRSVSRAQHSFIFRPLTDCAAQSSFGKMLLGDQQLLRFSIVSASAALG
jgi:hypothetical protein